MLVALARGLQAKERRRDELRAEREAAEVGGRLSLSVAIAVAVILPTVAPAANGLGVHGSVTQVYVTARNRAPACADRP